VAAIQFCRHLIRRNSFGVILLNIDQYLSSSSILEPKGVKMVKKEVKEQLEDVLSRLVKGKIGDLLKQLNEDDTGTHAAIREFCQEYILGNEEIIDTLKTLLGLYGACVTTNYLTGIYHLGIIIGERHARDNGCPTPVAELFEEIELFKK